MRDCARRSIRLIANEPDAGDAEEYGDKIRQIVADNDLRDEGDIIFVEVTVTDPSEFETALEVHGEVRHGTRRVLTFESSTVPERARRAAAPRAGPHRRQPAHLLRVDRGQPGHPDPAVPPLRRGRGRPGDPGGAARAEPDRDRRPHVHVG